MHNKTEIVIAWYEAEEWDTWRDTCDDGVAYFSESYELWRDRALAAAEQARALGRNVQPIVIRLGDFLVWAHVNAKSTNVQSRVDFAVECAARNRRK